MMPSSLRDRFDRLDAALWAAHADIAEIQWRWNKLSRPPDTPAETSARAVERLRELILGRQADDFIRRSRGCGVAVLAEAGGLLEAGREKLIVDTDPAIVTLVEAIDAAEMAASRDIRALPAEAAGRREEELRRRDVLGEAIHRNVRELQSLRNRRARELGHAGYPALVLRAIAATPADLRSWLTAAAPSPARATDAPDALWLEEAGKRRLDETASVLATAAPAEILERFCHAAGCRLADLADELNVGDSAAVGWFLVARPDDRRLALGSAKADLSAISCALHELGHAFRAQWTQPKSYPHLILQPPVTDEAVATVFERLATMRSWLTAGLGATEADVAAIREADRSYRAIRLRLLAAWSLFELDLYDDPQGDLQPAYAARLAQATGLPPARAAACHWAADGHGFFTEDPVYRYSYVLAEMISSNILPQLPDEISPVMIQRLAALSAAISPTDEWLAGG